MPPVSPQLNEMFGLWIMAMIAGFAKKSDQMSVRWLGTTTRRKTDVDSLGLFVIADQVTYIV